MKVAFCLSGHLRNFEYTHASILNNIIKPLNADVFIHTWNKLGYHNNFKPDSQELINGDTIHKLEKINNIYAPKKLIIESEEIIQKMVDDSHIYAPHLINEPKNIGHMASMHYKIMKCNELRKEYEKQENIKYDCVIRCRSDLLFQNGIMFHNLNVLDKINIPIINSFGGLNDQFAFSSPENMDIYSSLFYSIPTYFKSQREFIPEKILKWYLTVSNINIIPINIRYQLIR